MFRSRNCEPFIVEGGREGKRQRETETETDRQTVSLGILLGLRIAIGDDPPEGCGFFLEAGVVGFKFLEFGSVLAQSGIAGCTFRPVGGDAGYLDVLGDNVGCHSRLELNDEGCLFRQTAREVGAVGCVHGDFFGVEAGDDVCEYRLKARGVFITDTVPHAQLSQIGG